jgi:hypothetical protein
LFLVADEVFEDMMTGANDEDELLSREGDAAKAKDDCGRGGWGWDEDEEVAVYRGMLVEELSRFAEEGARGRLGRVASGAVGGGRGVEFAEERYGDFTPSLEVEVEFAVWGAGEAR